MKAIWFALLGATACTITIDEGTEGTDTSSDAGGSTRSATTLTSSPVASTGSASSVSSSASSGATTTATGASSNTLPSGTSSSNTTGTTSSGEGSTVPADSTTSEDASATLPTDSTDEVSSSDDTTDAMSGEDPEPGKLAGITERHNYYRALVDTDEPLPLLEWDEEVALLAQEWAEVLATDCSFEHSGRRGLGENLATFGASSERGLTSTGADAVDLWHSEVDCYTYGTIAGSSNMGTEECSSECDDYGGCGHYTQVVWRNSQRVGCGVASCFRDGFYWDTYVCNYDPPGNYIGQYPY